MSKTIGRGYILAVISVSVLLIWLGIYKFTPTEAGLIEPLIRNHPLMAWIYNLLSVQQVSNVIGTIEIVVGLGLLLGLRHSLTGLASGVAASAIFLVTISFMATTPDTWKFSDGVLITNFFLLKDALFLAVSVMVIETNKSALACGISDKVRIWAKSA
ncbi:DUF417 family protein [Shewanella sp. GXUN23E]|uniref:DUF417 family protein n=1 Tax=Shewanella sp. GXUN23E TaxID=3422498 RepID=UPI003D7DF779